MKYSLLILLLLSVFSCQMEPEKSELVQKKTQDKVLQTNPKSKPNTPLESVETEMKSFASSNSKINHNQIDFTLMENLLHIEINKVRKANGLIPFSRHSILINAARDQNNYCVRNGELSHYQTTAGKETLKKRIKNYGGGFEVMAENLIYEGFTVRTINGVKKEIITPSYQEMAKTMVKNWLGSPPHRANIMEKELKQVGTAIDYNPSNHALYATQVFGTRLNG